MKHDRVGQFIGLLATTLAALEAVPYAMLCGSITLVDGLLWLPLGQWLASVAAAP
jgi:hypothetical protein